MIISFCVIHLETVRMLGDFYRVIEKYSVHPTGLLTLLRDILHD